MSTMTEFKTINVNGYCNIFAEDKTIQVKYRKHTPLGESRSYAIAVNFSCENGSQCNKSNDCPIFKMAAQNYDW